MLVTAMAPGDCVHTVRSQTHGKLGRMIEGELLLRRMGWVSTSSEDTLSSGEAGPAQWHLQLIHRVSL